MGDKQIFLKGSEVFLEEYEFWSKAADGVDGYQGAAQPNPHEAYNAITSAMAYIERLETALRIIAKDDCSAAGEIAAKALEKGE